MDRKAITFIVLGAIAICKKYEDSEEILSLGPSAKIDWHGVCDEDCGDWHCGFCRYIKVDFGTDPTTDPLLPKSQVFIGPDNYAPTLNTILSGSR